MFDSFCSKNARNGWFALKNIFGGRGILYNTAITVIKNHYIKKNTKALYKINDNKKINWTKKASNKIQKANFKHKVDTATQLLLPRIDYIIIMLPGLLPINIKS